MDTDGRRSIFSNLLFIFIEMILCISARFYITKIYIVSNEFLNSILTIRLNKEGYEIINKSKGVYLVQPVLYERN